jgi:hypothetical protein
VHGGEYGQAEAYAHDAARAYPRGDPYLAALSHDMAYLWMEKGCFDRAIPVFTALLPRLDSLATVHHAHPWSSLARAAGGSGDDALFERAYREWQRNCDAHVPLASYLDVAKGALSLAAWEIATAVAEEGRARAVAAAEHKIVFEAESLVQQAASRQRITTASIDESLFADGVAVVQTFVNALTAV